MHSKERLFVQWCILIVLEPADECTTQGCNQHAQGSSCWMNACLEELSLFFKCGVKYRGISLDAMYVLAVLGSKPESRTAAEAVAETKADSVDASVLCHFEAARAAAVYSYDIFGVHAVVGGGAGQRACLAPACVRMHGLVSSVFI